MAGALENISHAAQRKAFSILIDQFLKKLGKTTDRQATYLKLVDEAEKFFADGFDKKNMDAVRKAIKDPDNRS